MKSRSRKARIMLPALLTVGAALVTFFTFLRSGSAPDSAVDQQSPRNVPPATAALAAKLANDECERHFGKRPFRPEHYPLVENDDAIRWGEHLKVVEGSFSAEVVFPRDRHGPLVNVYWHVDPAPPSVLPSLPFPE